VTITVAEAMTADVETVSSDMSLIELDRRFMAERRGGFPVVDAGTLVGVVSRSDVVRQLCVEQSVAEQASDYYREVLGPPPLAETLAELAARVGRRIQDLRVRDVMMSVVVSVSPRDTMTAVAQLLVERHIHRLPVVDDGRLVGILTTLDVVRLVAAGRLHA